MFSESTTLYVKVMVQRDKFHTLLT